MIDRRKRLHTQIAAELPADRGDFAAAVIPAASVIEQMSVHRAPLTAFAPRTQAARQYRDLWCEARDLAGLVSPALRDQDDLAAHVAAG
jgi:cellulose biosynthesis protein BcsQ